MVHWKFDSVATDLALHSQSLWDFPALNNDVGPPVLTILSTTSRFRFDLIYMKNIHQRRLAQHQRF